MFKRLAVMAALIVSILGVAPLCAFAEEDDIMPLAARGSVGLGHTDFDGSPDELKDGYYYVYSGTSRFEYAPNDWDEDDPPASYVHYEVDSTDKNKATLTVVGQVKVDTEDAIALMVKGMDFTITGDSGSLLVLNGGWGAYAAPISLYNSTITFGGGIGVTMNAKHGDNATGLSFENGYTGFVMDKGGTKTGSRRILEKVGETYSWTEIDEVTVPVDVDSIMGSLSESLPEKTYAAGNGIIVAKKYITAMTDGTIGELELKNATLTNSGGAAISLGYNSVKIVVTGENTLNGDYGINCTKSAKVRICSLGSEAGKLTINAKHTGIDVSGGIGIEGAILDIILDINYGERGIFTNGDFNIENSRLNEINIYANTGIQCRNFKMDNGKLSIKKDSSTGSEIGIKVTQDSGNISGNFEMNGGELEIEVSGDYADSGECYGIYTDKKMEFTGGTASIITVGSYSSVGPLTGKADSVKVSGTNTSVIFAGGKFDLLTNTVSVNGSLNAVVFGNDTYTAYGECSIRETIGSENDPVKVTVEDGAVLKVEEGKKLYVYGLQINGKLINNGEIHIVKKDGAHTYANDGTFENHGVVVLPSDFNSSDIKGLDITGGTGYVVIGNTNYNNNGTQTKIVNEIDLTNEEGVTAAGNATIDNDGYHYDSDTETLTLKNVIVGDLKNSSNAVIKCYNDNITIVCEGDVTVVGTIKVSGSGKTITIEGEENACGVVSIKWIDAGQNDILIKNISMSTDKIFNDYVGVVRFENAVVTTGSVFNLFNLSDGSISKLATDEDGNLLLNDDGLPYKSGDGLKTGLNWGVELKNSNLMVVGNSENESGFLTVSRVSMDDKSEIQLKNAIMIVRNTNTNPVLERELLKYVPGDGYTYKIGNRYNSIDKELQYSGKEKDGKPVYNIILKKQSNNGNDDGGGTDDGTAPPTPTTPSGGGGTTIQYKITVEETENGTVDSNRKYTSAGTRVTITTTANDKFVLGEIKVVDSKENEIELEDKGDGVFVFTMPKDDVWIITDFNSDETTTTKPTVVKTFKDVKDDDWFKNPVDYVTENGIMSGLTDDTFGPNELTSRAMLVTILWRMEGCPESSFVTNFTDINENEYYYKAVLWAAEKGIVSGITDTEFGPSRSVTREQFAAILFRYAGFKGYDTTQGGMAVREYLDFEEISEYALQSLTWAVNTGIISGRGNNKIEPNGGATRAEVASMIMRFKLIYER